MNIPPMKVVFLPGDKAEILEKIGIMLEAGQLAQGKLVSEFEELFAKRTGAQYAVAVSNGTAALEAVIRALDLKGGEVLVPTNTFIASAASVINAGGKAKLVDISPETVAPTIETLENAITPQTKAVMIVHIGGMITPDMPKILEWCLERNMRLIEDCSHAHGSMLDGNAAGTFGIAGTYSFFATKVMTSGEGGMVIARIEWVADKIKLLRDHGKPQPWVSEHVAIGNNYRMNELEAAVGLVQYRRLPAFIVWRERIAKLYRRALVDVEGIKVLWPANSPNSWYKFIALLPEVVDRAAFREKMRARGVSLSGGVYDLPLHAQPVAQELEGWQGEFPGANEFCSRHICLPLYFGMTDLEAEHVVDSLKRVLGEMIKKEGEVV